MRSFCSGGIGFGGCCKKPSARDLKSAKRWLLSPPPDLMSPASNTRLEEKLEVDDIEVQIKIEEVLPPTSKELNLPFASSPRLACTAMSRVTQLSPDVPTTTASRQRGSSKPLDKHTKAFEPIVTAI